MAQTHSAFPALILRIHCQILYVLVLDLQAGDLPATVATLILVIALILRWVTGRRYHFGSDGIFVVLGRVVGLVFARVVGWFVERAVEVDAGRGAVVLGLLA